MAEQLVVVEATFQCPSSTGNHDFTTTDLGGLTPKAAIFLGTHATSNGNEEAGATLSIGFTDGATQYLLAANHEDYVNETATEQSTSYCLAGATNDGGGAAIAWEYQASHDSWIEDGVRLNFDSVTEDAYFHVLFLAGSDLDVHVGTETITGDDSSTVDVTGPGFEPTAVVFASMGSTSEDSSSNSWLSSVGWAVNTGSGVDQASVISRVHGQYSGTSGEVDQIVSTTASWGELDSGAINHDVAVDSFDSSGFDMTPQTTPSSDTMVGYLAIKWGTLAAGSVVQTMPSSASGSTSFTGYGFQPSGLLAYLTRAKKTDTQYTDVLDAAGHSLVLIGKEGDTGAMLPVPAHAPNTSDRQDTWTVSLQDFTLRDEEGPYDIYAGSFEDWESDGFSLDVTTSPDDDLEFATLAFQDPDSVVTDASGSPQAQDATAAGSATVITTASGSVQADPATTSGQLPATRRASGSPQAQPASSTGVTARLMYVDGSAQAGRATSSGLLLRTGFFRKGPDRTWTAHARPKVWTDDPRDTVWVGKKRSTTWKA